MRAVVLAYSNIGCVGMRSLLRHGFENVAVFTHRDNPEETIWFDSVAELAAAHAIPVFAPEDINHPMSVDKIRESKPDILFSFYYRQLIRTEILNIPKAGCLNLHGSLLPKYRGKAPINWVLVNGEWETGVTLHYMTPRADEGDIVAQERITIGDDDTALTLHRKAAQAAEKLLDEMLPRMNRMFDHAVFMGVFMGPAAVIGLTKFAQASRQRPRSGFSRRHMAILCRLCPA